MAAGNINLTFLILTLFSVVNSQNFASVIDNTKSDLKLTNGSDSLSELTNGMRSKMAWMSKLFDHHDWYKYVNNVSAICSDDLKLYLKALNKGELWASKMYDASGRYSSSLLFGNDFMLGSLNMCSDLQLKQYYSSTPPYGTVFHVTRFNITLEDNEHIPQSRTFLLGTCLPITCKKTDIQVLLKTGADAYQQRSFESGVKAKLFVLSVREVPEPSYNILDDIKFRILGSITVSIMVLSIIAAIYEAYLEKCEYMDETGEKSKDVEMSIQNNNHDGFCKNGTVDCKVAETEDAVRQRIHHDNIYRKKSPSPNGGVTNGDSKINDRTGERNNKKSYGILSEILLSFSLLSNGRKILNTSRDYDNDTLSCLHGLRFMSVIWVIMVHTYLSMFSLADNKSMRILKERTFMYQSIGNASYSVDTFFFISGILVTILFLRTESKSSKNRDNIKEQSKAKQAYVNPTLSNTNISMISTSTFERDLMETKKQYVTMKEFKYNLRKFTTLVMYRFARLTPAYWFVIVSNEILMRYINNTSVFDAATADQVTCNLFWWRNVLYINNFYPLKEMCMVWSWYLSNDTQFYVLAVVLLLISARYLKFSMISAVVIMSFSWLLTIYISWSYNYKAKIQDPFEMFDPLYDKPWSRIGPYIVGMATGWLLHHTKCKIKMPYWVVCIGWPTSLAIMGSLIFGMVDGYFEVWPTAFYVSIGHTAWGVALSWVTLACCCGYGGIVNSMLSYGGIQPFSRLTYCAYLVHPTIMIFYTYNMDGPIHLGNYVVLTLYAGYAVMSFLVSFFISILYEAPVLRLMKLSSPGGSSKREPE